MKKNVTIFLLLVMILSTACGSKKVATKTSNTTSKSVDQVLQEKTGGSQNTDDKNHGGSVTNPDDTSNKKSASSQVPIISGGASQINGGSNMKKPSSNAGKVTQASDIDIDLTRLSSTMVYSEVYNMMNTPENYVGKMVRMNGKLAVYKYPERRMVVESLLEILGAVINIFHIGGINSKYPEASVEIAGSQRGFFPDFLSGAADTLLSNVADGRITCFSSLAFFPCYLWQLNKYKFAVLFLFYIYFHNRMRSCC